MITFGILLVLAIIAAIIALAVGAGFLAVFGDLLICTLIIVGLVKLFRRKKKK